jgi:hypothetical protein
MEFSDIFSSKKTWDWVLLLTYDFGPDYFFETEILNKIRACKNITVVMDESNYNNLISGSFFKPNYQGIYYNLEKVRIRNGGKFHSKLFIMVSDAEMSMIVGSANLTESGFKKNLECLLKLSFMKSSPERQDLILAAGLIKQIKTSFLEENELIDRRSVSLGLKKLFAEMCQCPLFKYIEQEASKGGDKANDKYFLSTIDGSLNSQIIKIIGSRFKKIQAMSPFYDNNAQLFDRVTKLSKSTDIYMPLRDSTFPSDKVDFKKYSKSIHFIGTERIERDKSRFIHAKYYRYTRNNGEEWDLITSANFTSAGMFSDGFPRNYETALLFKADHSEFLRGSKVVCANLESFRELVTRPSKKVDDQEGACRIDVESAHYDGQKIFLELSHRFLEEEAITDFIVELLIDTKKVGEYPIKSRNGAYHIQPSLEIEGDKQIHVRLKAKHGAIRESMLICVNREKHNPNYLPSLGASAFHQCIRLGGLEGIKKAFEFARASNRRDWLLFLLANWDLEKILRGLQRPQTGNNTGGYYEEGEIELVPYLRKPLMNKRNKRIYQNIDLSIKEFDFYDEIDTFVTGIENLSQDCNAALSNYIDYCFPIFIQIARYFYGLLLREERKKKEKPFIVYPEYNWLEIYNRNKEFLNFTFEHIKTRFFKLSRRQFENKKKYFALLLITYLLLNYQTEKLRREFINDCEEIAEFYKELVITLRSVLAENRGNMIKIHTISDYYESSLDHTIERLIKGINLPGEENYLQLFSVKTWDFPPQE